MGAAAMAGLPDDLHADLLRVRRERAEAEGDDFVLTILDIFEYIDADGSATLLKTEMKDCIKQNKMTNQYMRDMDADQGGHICAEEFVDYFVGLKAARVAKKEKGVDQKIIKEVKKNFRVPADMQRKEKPVEPQTTRTYTFQGETTTTIGGVDPGSVRYGAYRTTYS